jgi:BlaI family transcriptional regulator, penicillinase repressor
LEMEILPIVWRRGRATVRQVCEELYAARGLAYTTIMTVMKRLVDKNLLLVDTASIPFVYRPAVAREEVVTDLVDEVVERLLGGAAAPLVSYYLKYGKIAAKELQELEDLAIKRRTGECSFHW